MASGNEGINMSMPTRAQAVHLADSHWDQNGEEDEWHQHHFIHLIVKPLNYSQVTVVQQDPDENPLTFLQFLKDAIQKHTTVNPESHRLSIQSVYCNSTSLKRKKKIKTP
jgi:hypothetical protein